MEDEMSHKPLELGNQEVYVVCDLCFKAQTMPYGELANGEVPDGWVRAPDDKHHYCSQAHYDEARSLLIEPAQPADLEYVVRDSFVPEQIDVNAQGGKQSHVDQAFHRLDPGAMLTLMEVLAYGDSKYNETMCAIGDENWRKLDHLDHINHAGIHLFKHMYELQHGPKESDPEAGQHLSHALCRLMFALGSKPNV